MSNAAADWTPPSDWRPYSKGSPGRGRIKTMGPDGKSYSRPRTPEEQAEWDRRRKPAGAAGGGGSSDVRLTIPRLAEAMRDHMQMKEKFLAVMDEAKLSPKAVENLAAWLAEWRSQAAQRELDRKEADLRKLQSEIATLRRAAQPE